MSNLMILDNSDIDYSRMLLFVLGFLVYWKILQNKALTSKLSKKIKCDIKDNFLGFITINNISTLFFNWKIAAILFVIVIDYYSCVI